MGCSSRRSSRVPYPVPGLQGITMAACGDAFTLAIGSGEWKRLSVILWPSLFSKALHTSAGVSRVYLMRPLLRLKMGAYVKPEAEKGMIKTHRDINQAQSHVAKSRTDRKYGLGRKHDITAGASVASGLKTTKLIKLIKQRFVKHNYPLSLSLHTQQRNSISPFSAARII